MGGALSVAGESPAVLAEEIGGDVSIKNSFKNVVLRGTSGSISILGESSAVDIEGIKALPPGGVIDVKTSFKPIRVVLPAGTEVRGTARTESGKIITEFPVILRDPGKAGGRVVAFGTGKAGLTLKLETTEDITIGSK